MDTLNILSAPVLRSSTGHPNAALPVSALLVVTASGHLVARLTVLVAMTAAL